VSEPVPLAVIYSTFGSADDAQRVARTLVEERLIACANVVPGVTSIYRWKDEVHADAEVVLIAKTRADLVEPAMARLAAIHPYDVPCITSWPLSQCHLAYADWVRAETSC